MDLKALANLGKVAGIGGILSGVLLLVIRDVLANKVFANLPQDQAYRLLMTITIGVFLLGFLGVIAWIVAGRPPRPPAPESDTSVVAKDGSVVIGKHARGNKVKVSSGQPVPAGAPSASAAAAVLAEHNSVVIDDRARDNEVEVRSGINRP